MQWKSMQTKINNSRITTNTLKQNLNPREITTILLMRGVENSDLPERIELLNLR